MKSMLRVELIYDQECPNVSRARAVLLGAFAHAGLSPTWTEWNSAAPDAPPYARQYGSPTILVDGRDVAGLAPGDDPECCRVYGGASGGALAGVPSAEDVAHALRESGIPARTRSGWGWLRGLAATPGLGAALLPVGVCPACWPAYAGLLSSLGLGFLLETTYLLPITAALFLVALASLAWRAKERHGYGPLGLGTLATVAALLGKFVVGSDLLLYTGLPLLIGASLWHSWPRRAATVGGCPRCAAQPPSPSHTGAPTRNPTP